MDHKHLKKLLVVDDDKDILVITRYALGKMEGVDIHYIASGELALQEAVDFQPDLIILDVMMPRLDGIAVLKRLREKQETQKIPVIFFTAKVQKEEVDSYQKLGILDVIFKPFDPMSLSSVILSIWEKQFY
jgi:DNA-binding response OmpR family regulator